MYAFQYGVYRNTSFYDAVVPFLYTYINADLSVNNLPMMGDCILLGNAV